MNDLSKPVLVTFIATLLSSLISPILALIVAPAVYIFLKKKEKSEDSANESIEFDGTLTEKYRILKRYQTIAYLVMILSTLLTIGSIIISLESLKYTGPGPVILSVITWIITLFGLFGIIIIINFLYDLDLNKADK